MSNNNNFVAGFRSFASDEVNLNGYQAASGAAFNQVIAGGLAAYALFWIDGQIQDVGAAYAGTEFLWGNLDAAAAGWGLSIVATANQPVLTATLIAASGTRTASVALASDTLRLPQWTEKLICAGLWYDGTNLYLSVNGAIVAFDGNVGADAYTASGLAAMLGGNPANDGSEPASNCVIVSAGYSAGIAGLPFSGSNVGAFASSHFRLCREAFAGNFILDAASSFDWAHRYEAASAALSATPPTLTKNARAAFINGLSIAPSVIADSGNSAATALAGVTPVALNKTGAGNLRLEQIKNPDWYDGGAFSFIAPE